ncbi:hypothetical protein E2542_SST11037 [Spatholobus suberectus]|nr:hypothetical protein E2542_SST11037 [Spatholobus suberectus]
MLVKKVNRRKNWVHIPKGEKSGNFDQEGLIISKNKNVARSRFNILDHDDEGAISTDGYEDISDRLNNGALIEQDEVKGHLNVPVGPSIKLHQNNSGVENSKVPPLMCGKASRLIING